MRNHAVRRILLPHPVAGAGHKLGDTGLARICSRRFFMRLFVCLLSILSFHAAAQAPAPPLVKEGKTVKISEHVYVIPDELVPMVPNVGIVIGSSATLVVDPGMGARSGAIVLREAAKLSRNTEIYIVNTHFHPEHATGEAGFPTSAKVIRARAQQQDIDEMGMQWVQNFASRSPVVAEALQGFTGFRQPAELFDREKTIDLGGVSVRLLRLGPGHTRGDTVFFVEQDRVLFSGDLVMSRLFPAFATPQSRVDSWLASLDALDAFRAQRLVPAHGDLADASAIGRYRDYMAALQARVAELKRAGKSSNEAAAQLRVEFGAKYPDWTQPLRVNAAVNAIYAAVP
jgi:glyoxylase-like metal-dependent hydrolase (beta-lactamase superfamily II)